jgi:transcriptional regulator with XRE-family HTH domain
LWKSGGDVNNSYAQMVNALFGERLANVRRGRRISQKELGRRIERSRTTIANLEGGGQNVQLHQVFSIARALDAPIFDLLPQPNELPDSFAPALNPDSIFIETMRRQLTSAIGEDNDHTKQNRRKGLRSVTKA